jgi:hypothetical protein
MTMPMEIHGKDGTVLKVKTHVGDGFTVVDVWEEPAPEQPMEPSDEVQS